MKIAKLVIDGKEIEVQVSEEDFEELTTTDKITWYERIVGGKYFYDSGYGTCEIGIDSECIKHDLNYDGANYYSNINIATNNIRADKLMRQLRRFAVEHREKELTWCKGLRYYIYYDHEVNKIKIGNIYKYQDLGQIYFTSVEEAELAVETFKDELLWYFTEYRDSL